MSGRFHNRTRRSRSIPLALLRRGRLPEIPLYYLLRLSDLAREGIDHSGSHRFADHIYRGEPSGRGRLGRWLDARLLAMPAARAFRFRFLATRDELASFLVDRARSGAAGSGGIDVLSVPCGIPRELMEASALVRSRLGSWPCRIALHGLDLDAAVLDEARAAVAGSVDDAVEGRVEGGAGGGAAAGARPAFQAIHGNALSPSAYGKTFDFITCTGLTEFLDDTAVAALYGIFFSMLKPDGKLVTSGMTRRWTSDYLLRLGELQAHYRSADDLRRLIGGLGFREVRTWHDATGLQTMMSASK